MNKTVLIVVGVLIVGTIGYFVWKKHKEKEAGV